MECDTGGSKSSIKPQDWVDIDSLEPFLPILLSSCVYQSVLVTQHMVAAELVPQLQLKLVTYLCLFVSFPAVLQFLLVALVHRLGSFFVVLR